MIPPAPGGPCSGQQAEVCMSQTSQGTVRIACARLSRCLRRWPARAASLLWALATLVVPVLAFTAGCNSLNFLRPRDKPSEKIEHQTMERGSDPLRAPGTYSFRIAPYVFLSDFEIPRNQPLFAELAQLRDQVYKELLLPPGSAVVQVYLFETEARYKRFMEARYPDLPQRRAFFVAQPRTIGGAEDLLVYTYWGERIRQDLRHELTHALLHSVIKEVPLWLDEGLAEYFELPPERDGQNASHVEVLRRNLAGGSVKLNLARLEGLRQVDDMNPAEYRESWAWVHLMLRSKPEAKTVLLSYLQQLRGSRHPGQLGPKLMRVYPALEEALAAHVEGLQPPRAASTLGLPLRREVVRP
jgi:hypothetical protein